ncbi:2-amino-4-deoxychorismate dehydrogenase [bioreactor metagenome]|uniref:2-amino-4-deoxychorismate dehydrogenase n=1 Tax=bioreactor metagenome TaxID=1076179 RepID=A0A644X2H7_9ZZZZ
MKLLAICGSPREHGNTEYYLNLVLEEARKLGAETSLIWLGDKNIRGCRGCYGCVKAKHCVTEDDFQDVFSAMAHSDGILLGSPVYHSSVTSEMKALLDRAGFSGRWAVNEMQAKDNDYEWKGCVFSGKVVAPVTVARRAGHNFAFAQLLLWAACNDCVIVGNTYWNVGVAGKGGAADAAEDKEGVDIMKGLARRMVGTISALNQHKGA